MNIIEPLERDEIRRILHGHLEGFGFSGNLDEITASGIHEVLVLQDDVWSGRVKTGIDLSTPEKFRVFVETGIWLKARGYGHVRTW